MFSHPWTESTARRIDKEQDQWEAAEGGGGGGSSGSGGILPSALRRIRLLNDQLKERSRRLLVESSTSSTLSPSKSGVTSGFSDGKAGVSGNGGQQRGQGERDGSNMKKDQRRGEEEEEEEGGTFGSYEFNVALINRMEPSEDRPDLKLEPTFGQDRCVMRPVVLAALFRQRIAALAAAAAASDAVADATADAADAPIVRWGGGVRPPPVDYLFRLG